MIGFVGAMGSGKTTAAEYLVKEYGYRKFSFAEPIKTYIQYVLGFDKSNPAYRKAAQDLGMWGRGFDDQGWVNFMEKRIGQFIGTEEIAIDDVRFTNESEMLIRNGFKIIELRCPSEIRMERCLKRDGYFDKKTMNHISEKTEALKCTKSIDNSKDLNLLYEELDILMFEETWGTLEADVSFL